MALHLNQKHHVSTDMDKVSYADYESEVGDGRNPRFTEKILTDSDISSNNLSPESVGKLLTEGYVVKLHRSMRDEIPLLILLVLSIVTMVGISISLEGTIPTFPVQVFSPLVIVGIIVHRRYNATYFIESGGIAIVKGILTFNLSRMTLEYKKMRAIEVGKNLLERFLNVGDVRISTRLFDSPGIAFRGIANPYFYATVIRNHIHEVDESRAQEANVDD